MTAQRHQLPQYLLDVQTRIKQRRRGKTGLSAAYASWHWGSKPKKFINVRDNLVPDLVGIGKLVEIKTDQGSFTFPEGCWLGFDPFHPHERIHIVLSREMREKVRKLMKKAGETQPLQKIAESAGGTQTRFKMPNLKGARIGVMENFAYDTLKLGEENGGSNVYEHVLGREHSRGVKPIIAADASGRLWLCGGSATCPDAGVTG